MNTNKLFTACLVALGMATSAYAIPESEPNNALNAAQGLSGSSTHSIQAMMGAAGDSVHDDLDFFTFEAQAGDVLDVDIDNGYGGSGNINSIVGIYNASGTLLRMNAYSSGVDSGSSSILDARIDKFVAPSSGTYTVAVSNVPRYFINGGGTLSFFGTTTTSVGDYTLNISGITVANRTQQINIEVKPGSHDLAPLNPRAKGKVPVAIMGSASFDVSGVKQTTLTFGSTGNEKSLSKCQKVTRDINNDGYADQLCHFENRLAGFKGGDIEGILKGETTNGTQFEGRSLLKVVPSKRK
jgi:hypothetical protein